MINTSSKISEPSNTMTMKAGLMSAALLALFTGGGGCADHVQSAVVACPCDRGVCCASGVCAADEGSCAQATEALSSESAGRWTGYIENQTLLSGSDALDLALQVGDDGALSGQLILGVGPAPAAPTDGAAPWPPGYTLITNQPAEHVGVIEGFAYHVTNLRWTALRLRFEVSLGEPWGPWCELQESAGQAEPTDPTNTYPYLSCRPGPSEAGPNGCVTYDESGALIRVDCAVYNLCLQPSGACHCTDAACRAGTFLHLEFDVALRGNEGDGSLDDAPNTWGLTVFGRRNVRLIRASN